MNTSTAYHIPAYSLLLQPPPGDLTGPYPALAYLKSYAEQYGHEVRVRDLAIESFSFLVGERTLSRSLARAHALMRELEAKSSLKPSEQRRYRVLMSVAAIGSGPSVISDALKIFKDRNRFYNYPLYKQACAALNSMYRLLSALHYPTVVTPSEYPEAQALNSFESVMEHCGTALNPFIDYYESVLFPQVAERPPAIIGISMEFASQSVQALVLGRLLKERFPSIHVTMGGAYLSQWALLMGEAQCSWLFNCTDSVVLGEGERAFTLLLDHVASGRSLDDIPNLMHSDASSGAIQRFTSIKYPNPAELPPPDYSDLDLAAYLIPKPVIPYCVSRGCYWGKCVFCQNRYGENRMRPYQTVPVDKALAEMSFLAEKHGANHFNFSNDVIDPAYLKRFSEAVTASGKKFRWNTDLRAGNAVTPDLCRLMARAGLNSVAIGVESGCQRTLDAMHKGKQVDTVGRVMKDLYDNGVATQAMGFFGFPGETEEEAGMTVSLLEQNADRISYYVIGLLMVLPGSKMHEDPEKYGVTSISYDGNALMAPQPVWRSDTRIPGSGVNRLYHRLSHLEEIFAINDYPYVGALCTNHSFLYFERGPDILKRLKAAEKQDYSKLIHVFTIQDRHAQGKKLKALVPRFAFPSVVYSSPFSAAQISADAQARPSGSLVHSGAGAHYLVPLCKGPIEIGPAERRLLENIDGRRNLKSIFSRLETTDSDKAVSFFVGLVFQGLVSLGSPQR
jgi:anaerobic magnesium-protoporphyrin IX monomethyl ester cyclase